MKTQISNLRSGTKNQILNAAIDYSLLPKSTSHVGHSGSNTMDVENVWGKVILENPNKMNIVVNDLNLQLTANWSGSGKTVFYTAIISKEMLEEYFFIKAAKKETPYISIQHGNIIVVSNGKNSRKYICPSMFEIV